MKKIFLHIIACLSMVITLSLTFATLFAMSYAFCELEEAIGITIGRWYSIVIHVTLLFTVILDTACMVELDCMHILNKFGAFKAWDSTDMNCPFFWYPHSMIYMVYKNVKNEK